MSDASGNLLAALKCLDRGVTVHVRIKDIDDTDDFKLTVEGDVTDLAGAGARFREVAPVGADQDSGEAQLDPWTKASRWLWAGYMYEPPLVGYTSANGIERKAPGPDNDPATPDANLKGQYYCWNRTYDIGTGRWTTPDPAASPVTNLMDYATDSPDPSGLGLGKAVKKHSDADAGDWKALGKDENDNDKDFLPARKNCWPIDSVLFYDQTQIESTNKADLELNYPARFKKHIQHFTETHKYGVRNVRQIFETLKELVESECPCMCIKKASFVMHGFYGGEGFHFGGDAVSGQDNGTLFGRLLKNAMCPDCKLNMMTCLAREYDTKVDASVYHRIGDASGCKVRYIKACYKWQQGLREGAEQGWGFHGNVFEYDPKTKVTSAIDPANGEPLNGPAADSPEFKTGTGTWK